MVKPAGTGKPILVISARPAPLPPRRSRQVPSPSALPAPKKYTHFFTVRLACPFFDCGTLAAIAIPQRRPKKLSARRLYSSSSNTLDRLSPLFTADFRKISDRRKLAKQFRKQRQAIISNRFVLRHHHHAVEKMV